MQQHLVLYSPSADPAMTLSVLMSSHSYVDVKSDSSMERIPLQPS